MCGHSKVPSGDIGGDLAGWDLHTSRLTKQNTGLIHNDFSLRIIMMKLQGKTPMQLGAVCTTVAQVVEVVLQRREMRDDNLHSLN